jgi:hypothetical protein
MAGSADDARRLVDGRTTQLARLHWELRSQAARIQHALRWLDAVEAPRPHAHVPSPRRPAAPLVPCAPAEVLPPSGDGRTEPAATALRMIVSEQRQVSLEVVSRIPAAAPETEPRHRLAS